MSQPVANPAKAERRTMGLVLAGGAARGAYEVGVLDYIVNEVSDALGYDVPLDVLSGTSVGAINCCSLAAYADEPRARVARLSRVWSKLEVEHLLQPRARGVTDLLRGLFGRGPSVFEGGGVFEARYLDEFIRRAIPFQRIDTNLREGRLRAVTVSATHVASGRTVVFVQRRRAQPPPWAPSPNMLPRSVRLRPIHALASAAVPLLFPPVQIEGRYFCDGGLRQNVPLSPARRLGSDALIVINPRFVDAKAENPLAGRRQEEIKPTPLTIVGKTLNALMLDRIDHDLERLRKVNAFIDAGSSVFGSSFSKDIRQEMNTSRSTGLRKIDVVHIRPSQNIGQMCTAFVQSKEFRVGGIVGKVMKRLAESDATREADLLSYLLLDGSFASQLIELGKQDGRRYHDALCELFERHRTRAGQ